MRLKYFFITCVSTLLMGLYAVLGSIMNTQGITSMAYVGIRGAAALLILLPLALRSGKMKLARNVFFKIILLSSLGNFSTNILLLTSYIYLPVGLTTTIHYFFPLVVNLVLLLVYREKPTLRTILAFFLSFSGILIACFSGIKGDIKGIIPALLSIVSWSFYVIYYERSGLAQVNIYVVLFYMFSVHTILGILFAALGGELSCLKNINGPLLVFIFLTAAVGVINILGYNIGVKNIGSGLCSIIGVLEPLGSIFFGCIILREPFTLRMAVAVILILAGVVSVLKENLDKAASIH